MVFVLLDNNMNCIKCKKAIPEARIQALPETKTCVQCSNVQPYRAIISGSYKHKMTETHIIKSDDPILDYYEEQWQGR